MFLNIQKIGKAKHKFKAKINFIKFNNQATQKGVCIKVKIQRQQIIDRGSHSIQAISQPSKKGIAKYSNEQYVIPMTMFCDDSESQIKYLPKDAQIKAYECDENGKQGRKVGKKQLDLSEYANKGKLKLQIELDPQKKIDAPILTLQMFLERQEDDSKSVQSYSNDNDAKNQRRLQQQKPKDIREKYKKTPQKMDKQDTKTQKSNTLSVPNENYGHGQQKLKLNKLSFNIKKKSDQKRKMSEDGEQNLEASPDSKTPFPKGIQMQNRKKSLSQSYELPINNTKIKDVIKQTKQKQWNNQSKKPIKQQQHNQNQDQLTAKKGPIQTQFKNGQSPQLQAFLLQKALRQKQSEIATLKRQNQNYKRTIDKLIQQSSTAKQTQKKMGYQKDIEEMKKNLVSKDIEIDKLQTSNKTLTSRQQQYEKTIMKLRQQLIISKQKISDMKYKQAFLMQQLFQSANKEALQQASRFLSV